MARGGGAVALALALAVAARCVASAAAAAAAAVAAAGSRGVRQPAAARGVAAAAPLETERDSQNLTAKHVVFILLDDWGSYDAGFRARQLGREPQFETPHIDALLGEERAVLLEDYYVQPICTPTRSTLLSGRYQTHTGLQHDIIQNGQDNAVDPDGKFELLPEAMKRAGLATHMVGKWHIGFARERYCPWRRGFDSFVGYLSGAEDYYLKTAGGALDWWNGSVPLRTPEPHACPYYPGSPAHEAHDQPRKDCENSYSTQVYTQEVRRLIRAHRHSAESATSPSGMFLYLAMQAVHWPMEAPLWALRRVPAALSDPWRRYYAAMTVAADAALGEVVAELKAQGMWGDTLLVLSSDNGGMSMGYNGPNSTCGGLNYPYRCVAGLPGKPVLRAPAVGKRGWDCAIAD